MKRLALIVALLLVAAVSALVISVFAQAATSPWAYFVMVTPGSQAAGIYDLTVPLEVMDKAREDLADLRLYD
ncbi:MAG TPA: hypothetical protein VIF64_12540, partial [Pyrinomonadaceae bacterium]